MNEHGRRGYKVVYDFDLKVPRGTALYLATINEGRINVEKTNGDFDIENINGSVQMDEIGGSGRVYALNGKVAVTFAKNPERSSYFGSLNGAVDVWFQPNLSADARVKTFNAASTRISRCPICRQWRERASARTGSSCIGTTSFKGSALETVDRNTSSRILTAISESGIEDRNEERLFDFFSGCRRCRVGAGRRAGARDRAL